MHRRRQLALGLLAGAALDAVLPDPRAGHPVAAFGSAAAALERQVYRDSTPAGAVFTALCVTTVVAGGAAVERRCASARGLVIAAGTWAVLGGRSLRTEARAMYDLIARADLAGARLRVTHLVGRDPSALDLDGLARATVESVAENTCDAVVAPLLWGAVAGLPGLLGYRAVNTLDAMVGHRSDRYANFGWASARLDDLANLVPARVSAGLVALCAPTVGGRARAALHAAVRDGGNHPSPNSGRSEAAYAGALGVRLGGRIVYAGRIEARPHLGNGRAPTADDLPRAARLCGAVTVTAALFAAAVAGAARTRGSGSAC